MMVPGYTDNGESMKFVQILKPVNHLIDRIEILLPYSRCGEVPQAGYALSLGRSRAYGKERAKELEIYANKVFAEGLRKDRKRPRQATRKSSKSSGIAK